MLRNLDERSGAHIPPVIARGAYPIDVPWEDLSPEHRDLIRCNYIGLGEKDEPPFPQSPVTREVWKVQSRLLVAGPPTLTARVDSTGRPSRWRSTKHQIL